MLSDVRHIICSYINVNVNNSFFASNNNTKYRVFIKSLLENHFLSLQTLIIIIEIKEFMEY